jgi:hypothetical protein
LQPHHYSIPNNVIAKDEEGEFKTKFKNPNEFKHLKSSESRV